MNVSNIEFKTKQLLGTEAATAVAMEEKTVYRDGAPTDDKVTAITVTSPESGYEKITVKLEQKPNFTFTTEDLTARNVAGDFVKVKFIGDVCKIWTDRAGNSQISARAKSAQLVDDEQEINL